MTIDPAVNQPTAPANSDHNPPEGAVDRFVRATRAGIHRLMVGKDEAIDLTLTAILCGGNVLIEDVPGTGKTTLSKALAWSLDCNFGRIQFTPDLMPADVLGVNVFNLQTSQFEFRAGPIFCQVLLADEINRATPRTQSALLEAMQEHQVSIDGVTMPLPAPFIVIATLNPIEMEGTFPLPEAQLDRFMLRVSLGYPTRDEELEMLDMGDTVTDPSRLAPVTSPQELENARQEVNKVLINDVVKQYVLDIVQATRGNEQLQLGASPRATLALYHATQAWAAIRGRPYVIPDDVKDIVVSVLSHRIITAQQSRLRGLGSEQLIAQLVDNIPVPIER